MNIHTTSPNKWVSGFATLRQNPRLLARTSDTRQPLYEMALRKKLAY